MNFVLSSRKRTAKINDFFILAKFFCKICIFTVMKQHLISFLLAILPFTASASDIYSIIPAPAKVESAKGNFRLNGVAFKCDPSIDSKTKTSIQRFATDLSRASGKLSSVSFPLGLSQSLGNDSVKGFIFVKDTGIPSESYSIKIESGRAIVRASDFNGFLYSIQTIRQLLPDVIFSKGQDADQKWVLPCCTIEDSPRFSWRGMHLDSSRHFWQVDEVKKYLDVMAMYKMNRFHWHLTDDQGWRIEIKAYPLLTQAGGFRSGTMTGHDFGSNDHTRYGGWYSQEDIKEIVSYAADRGITVIPEIDLPGHMLAALAAYDWLGCGGGPYQVWHKWGVSDQVLCAGKESTYTFLEKVLSEVAELFPGEYIHIGGDECPKTEWENCPDCQARIAELGLKDDDKFSAEQYLQSYVTARIQKFLASKGKKIIGWDEILEGQLEPGATVMSWRGVSGAREAASKGFDAIMCPTDYCYLNFRQAEDASSEPIAFDAFLPIEKVYSLDPTEGISGDMQQHIIGVQGNLWTEYIDNQKLLEYMLLPRMLAVAEVQWCAPANKDFSRFKETVISTQFPILKNAGYTCSRVIEGISGNAANSGSF